MVLVQCENERGKTKLVPLFLCFVLAFIVLDAVSVGYWRRYHRSHREVHA